MFIDTHCHLAFEDNIDKILAKYNISKEALASYNDISNIKVGDKLIIPEVKNEQ